MFLKTAQGVVQQFAKENSSAILTAGGCIGVVATAVLTGRAAIKAHELIIENENERFEAGNVEVVTMMDKAILVGPTFIPPVIVGVATIGSIVAANMMSAKRAAALAAAYGISQRQLDEYKAKVQEKLTGPKNQAIKDEIAQDRVDGQPPTKEVIILGGGDVLCYDMLTGRYFQSTVEQIRKAESKINAELLNHQCASLSSFYDEIGLPSTSFTETVGWNISGQDLLGVELSTVMTPDQKPCIAIDFNTMPSPNYSQYY